MKKRRHHFVWQYYLKPWTVDGRIACWRNGQVFRTDPTNVAVERDFYRLRDISERDVATIRQMIHLFPSQLRDVHNTWLEMFTLPFELRRILKATGQSDRAIEEALDTALANTEEEIHTIIEAEAQSLLLALRNGDVGFFATEDGFSRFMHFLSVQYLRTKNIRNRAAFKSKQSTGLWWRFPGRARERRRSSNSSFVSQKVSAAIAWLACNAAST